MLSQELFHAIHDDRRREIEKALRARRLIESTERDTAEHHGEAEPRRDEALGARFDSRIAARPR